MCFFIAIVLFQNSKASNTDGCSGSPNVYTAQQEKLVYWRRR